MATSKAFSMSLDKWSEVIYLHKKSLNGFTYGTNQTIIKLMTKSDKTISSIVTSNVIGFDARKIFNRERSKGYFPRKISL